MVVFRAENALLLRVLANYAEMCRNAGAPADHLYSIDDAAAAVSAWQASHGVKSPGT